MIRKLLIANRGEIAVRVIRTAREMGIRTVAVYSDADAGLPHARLADEAVALGSSEPAASYLNVAKILAAAEATGADAVHPGYGFLSERADFVEACDAAGLTFVGPSAAAMRRLGSKTDAKALAVEAGVPVVPGYFANGATVDELRQAAGEIGYPVLLKASAGGGGRGMRVVRDPARFDEEFETASDEALKAFGDGAMMVERLIDRPRHIEVQIMADGHGGVAALFERECSIQRRHQKLIEEAASPYSQMAELWPKMREAAKTLVRAAEYVGAGTVEFIVDPATGGFYFLEVNARLQVEHPVTEAITGLDLVRCQLEVAAGEPLNLPEPLWAGERSAIRGHAIEARVVAEDPERGFLPSVGPLLAWAEPKGPGVRVDTGYAAGVEVPRFYDSLLAKVIAVAATRDEAIARLIGALNDLHILGVRTNVAFLLDVLGGAPFREGDLDTGLLEREFGSWNPGPPPGEIGVLLARAQTLGAAQKESSVPQGAWAISDAFRNARA